MCALYVFDRSMCCILFQHFNTFTCVCNIRRNHSVSPMVSKHSKARSSVISGIAFFFFFFLFFFFFFFSFFFSFFLFVFQKYALKCSGYIYFVNYMYIGHMRRAGSSVGCASIWHADSRGSTLGSGNIRSWRLVMNSFSLPLVQVGQLGCTLS